MDSYLTTGAAALLGVVAPAIISLLKKNVWPVWVKLLLTVGVSLLFAVLAVYTTVGPQLTLVTTEEYIQLSSVVFTVATLFYKAYFRHTEVNDDLEKALYKQPRTDPNQPVV